MVLYLLSMLMVAVRGISTRPAARKTPSPGVVISVQPVAAPAPEVPSNVEPFPDPPVLAPAPVEILDRTEIFRRLRQLELGIPQGMEPAEDHERVVSVAAAAIG